MIFISKLTLVGAETQLYLEKHYKIIYKKDFAITRLIAARAYLRSDKVKDNL